MSKYKSAVNARVYKPLVFGIKVNTKSIANYYSGSSFEHYSIDTYR